MGLRLRTGRARVCAHRDPACVRIVTEAAFGCPRLSRRRSARTFGAVGETRCAGGSVVRIRAGAAVMAVLAALVLAAGAEAAAPGSIPVGASWQTNGRVETVVVSGTTAYLGGEFTSVRPSGDPAGTGEVARNHAAAINLATGALLPWDPNANNTVQTIAVNGQTVLPGRDVRQPSAARRTRGSRRSMRPPAPRSRPSRPRRTARSCRSRSGRTASSWAAASRPPTRSPATSWPRSTPPPARS